MPQRRLPPANEQSAQRAAQKPRQAPQSVERAHDGLGVKLLHANGLRVDRDVEQVAGEAEQGQRARKLFAAVVLAALDDAIADDKKYGNGAEQIARWARSRDGREVLSCAGIDPNERVVKGLVEFVSKGVRTSVALSREESERRMAAEADEAEAA